MITEASTISRAILSDAALRAFGAQEPPSGVQCSVKVIDVPAVSLPDRGFQAIGRSTRPATGNPISEPWLVNETAGSDETREYASAFLGVIEKSPGREIGTACCMGLMSCLPGRSMRSTATVVTESTLIPGARATSTGTEGRAGSPGRAQGEAPGMDTRSPSGPWATVISSSDRFQV